MHAALLALVALVGCDNGSETGETGPAVVDAAWEIVDIGMPLESLRGVDGTSADEVYIAGGRGLILENIDGAGWDTVHTGASKDFTALWSAGPQDSWVAGDEIVLRYEGAGWTSVTLPDQKPWATVWGTGSEVWLGGSSLGLLHFDGSTWGEQTQPGGFRFGIWGASASDVFAVGSLGTIHYDGTTWEWSDSDPTATGEAVWGSSGTDVWVAGWRFDSNNNPIGHLTHYDGGGWVVDTTALKPLHAIWGSSASNVWAVGDAGTLVHWDGASWTSVDVGVTGGLWAIWGSGPYDIWAVGDDGVVLHYSPV